MHAQCVSIACDPSARLIVSVLDSMQPRTSTKVAPSPGKSSPTSQVVTTLQHTHYNDECVSRLVHNRDTHVIFLLLALCCLLHPDRIMPEDTPSKQIQDMFDKAVDTASGISKLAFVKAFLTVGASWCPLCNMHTHVCLGVIVYLRQ